MGPLLLLGMAAACFLILGPIAGFVALSRTRRQERQLELLTQAMQRLHTQQSALQKRLQELASPLATPPVGPAVAPGAPPARSAEPAAAPAAVTPVSPVAPAPAAPPQPTIPVPADRHDPVVTGTVAAAIAAAHDVAAIVTSGPRDLPAPSPVRAPAGVAQSPTATHPRPPTARQPAPGIPRAASPPPDERLWPFPGPSAPRPGAGPRPAADERTMSAMEGMLGTRLMTWIGVGILFLGMAFFLKFAYDQHWLGRVLGPRARVVCVVAVGMGFLAAGRHVLRQGMAALGQGLLGGGIAILYLAVYGAFSPTLMIVPAQLLSPHAAFALMALVTALGVGVALRFDAMVISIIAVLGGFATPLVIGSDGNGRDILFTYLLVLDLGVLGVALYRRWRTLDVTTLAGTIVLFALWFDGNYASYPSPPNWGTLAWIGIFHAVFLALPFIHHWRTRTPITVARFGLALANLAWSLGYACDILSDTHPRLLAVLCLALGGCYLAIGLITVRRIGDDRRVLLGFTALATMLLTLGLFYLLPVDGITVAWFVEACVLLALGYLYAYAPTRWASLGILGLALARVACRHLPDADPAAALFLNMRFAMQCMAPLGLAGFATVHRLMGARHRDLIVTRACAVSAGIVLLLLASLEIGRDADAHAGHWVEIPAATAAAWLWSLGTAGYLLAGARWRQAAALLTGVLALAGAVLAMLLSYLHDWSWALPVLNPRFLSALAVLALACWFAWTLTRLRTALPAAGTLAAPLQLFAPVLGVLLLTLEAAGWMQRHAASSSSIDLQWVLSVIWLGSAVVLAVLGLAWSNRRLVLVGLLPLVLGTVGALALYGEAWGMPILVANGRFIAGMLALGAGILHGVVLERQLQASAFARSVLRCSALIGLAVLLSLEVATWSWATAPAMATAQWICCSLGVVWLLSAVTGLIADRLWTWPAVWLTGMVLLQLSVLISLTLYPVGWDAAWMFLNVRFLLVAGTIAALAGFTWSGPRAGTSGEPVQDSCRRLMRWEMLAVTFLALSAEPPAWFLAHIADQTTANRLATFSVTVMWTLLASAWLTLGFVRRLRALRLGALGLYALTAAKLLVMDMAQSQQLYRILAFFVVGIVFVAAAYAYHIMERRLSAPGRPALDDPPGVAGS